MVVDFPTLEAAAPATLVVGLALIVVVAVVVMIQGAEVAAEATILEAEVTHEVYRGADADQHLSHNHQIKSLMRLTCSRGCFWRRWNNPSAFQKQKKKIIYKLSPVYKV